LERAEHAWKAPHEVLAASAPQLLRGAIMRTTVVGELVAVSACRGEDQ